MKNKLFIGLIFVLLITALTAAVSAEDLYTFTLSQGASVSETSEFWYLDLKAPVVSGMADEKEQEELNKYFTDYVDYIAKTYEEDKVYFTENFEEEGMPRFGYEYAWEQVYENDNYFVFKTWAFYAAGSSMTVNEYWTLDKHSGKVLQITDVADKDRLTQIRGMIHDEMVKKNEEHEIFWVDDETYEMAFSYIEEYHHWYINEAGNLVITFDKYEVAPGAFGSCEFEIIGDKATLIEDDKYSFDLYVGDTYTEESKNWSIKLTIPVVHGLADKEEEDKLNAHFAEYAARIKADFEELKADAEKSIAEGNDPHFSYEYNYEILSLTDDYLVFKTEETFVAASLSNRTEYWTLDRNSGKLLKFSDFVPEEARQSVYDQIYSQMKAANDSGEAMYFLDDDPNTLEVSLSIIDETHHWYLNENGEVVVVFDKYDIAPGAMGPSEFVIQPANE